MFKMILKKAEESEIKLPISVGSSKKYKFQKSIYFCFTDYDKAFDSVDHNNCGQFLNGGTTKPPDLPPEKSVCRSGSNS